MSLAHWLTLGIAVAALVLSWRERIRQAREEEKANRRLYCGPLLGDDECSHG